MCTVTFLPTGETDFVLTSNRDEQTTRLRAIEPMSYMVNDTEVFFPKDRQAEGTWMACSGHKFTLCLLNGAFTKHERKQGYAKSRGLVLLDFFLFNDVDTFLSEYDFSGIEPFTMLFLDTDRKIRLTEARWDEVLLHQREVNAKRPHIWSSVTLYSTEMIKKREDWFLEFLSGNQQNKADQILNFHHFAGREDTENGLIMNRENRVRTVSITSVSKQNETITMTYKDVIDEKVYTRTIP